MKIGDGVSRAIPASGWRDDFASARGTSCRRVSTAHGFVAAGATVRARLRASEFGMTALAIGVGVLAGLCVAAMTKIVNVAHIAIFGIPFDVHLSAAERVAANSRCAGSR